MIKGWFNPHRQDENQPDKLLARYVATGDSAVLNLLVAQFNPMLFHYLLSQSDHHLAEDVLQNTWLKVINSAASFDFAFTQQRSNSHLINKNKVKSWLFKIARNTLIDELRRQNRWQWHSIIEDDIVADIKSMDKKLILLDQLAVFNHAITQLSFHQREAFIFQQEGLSLDEICQLTEASFETVKSRIRYAKVNLKKQMEQSNECK